MTDRRVPGGSLRIRAAASPRNLAGHTWRDLFMDEVDRFEPTREGSATALAEKRTLFLREPEDRPGLDPDL